jgi:hypothetical protein
MPPPRRHEDRIQWTWRGDIDHHANGFIPALLKGMEIK